MKTQREHEEDVKFILAIAFLVLLFFSKNLMKLSEYFNNQYQEYKTEQRQEKVDLIREAVYGQQK